MRVLILNYEFPPLGGGAANACYYIVTELATRNICVDLVTSSATNTFELENIGKTANIYRLSIGKKAIHYWTQREILTYSWKARFFIKKLLAQNQYDLCHAFFGIPCGAIAYLFRKQMPYIVSLRGSDVPGFNKRFSFQYVFLKPVIKRVWHNSYAVIANSLGLKELAQRTSSSCDIGVIYNGIDTKQFKPAEKNSKSKLRILCVSRLIQRKGVESLIKALAGLKEDFGDTFDVLIVGEGNLEQELKQLAIKLGLAETIAFTGYVEHSELPDIYASSDIFVLPSLSEGMSNTVLEAMACGLPIITTDTGGSNELINGNGVILTSTDPDTIALALRELIGSSELRVSMSNRSRELAEKFSWSNVATEYLRIYEEMTGQSDKNESK
ncbi:glycosyltransferase family 4 protein [Chloroflexota bacterium]